MFHRPWVWALVAALAAILPVMSAVAASASVVWGD
jgi:hypothetical protein